MLTTLGEGSSGLGVMGGSGALQESQRSLHNHIIEGQTIGKNATKLIQSMKRYASKERFLKILD